MKFDYKKYRPDFLGVYLFVVFLLWAVSLLWPLIVTVKLIHMVIF